MPGKSARRGGGKREAGPAGLGLSTQPPGRRLLIFLPHLHFICRIHAACLLPSYRCAAPPVSPHPTKMRSTTHSQTILLATYRAMQLVHPESSRPICFRQPCSSDTSLLVFSRANTWSFLLFPIQFGPRSSSEGGTDWLVSGDDATRPLSRRYLSLGQIQATNLYTQRSRDLARFPRSHARPASVPYQITAPGQRRAPGRLTFIHYSIDFPLDGGTPIHHRFPRGYCHLWRLSPFNKQITRLHQIQLPPLYWAMCQIRPSPSGHHISTRPLGRFRCVDMGLERGHTVPLKYLSSRLPVPFNLLRRGLDPKFEFG